MLRDRTVCQSSSRSLLLLMLLGCLRPAHTCSGAPSLDDLIAKTSEIDVFRGAVYYANIAVLDRAKKDPVSSQSDMAHRIEIWFAKDGRETRRIVYGSRGDVTESRTIEYRLGETRTTITDTSKSTITVVTAKFGMANTMIGQETTFGGEIVRSEKCFYDEKRRLVLLAHCGKDRLLFYRRLSYDSTGNAVRDETCDRNDEQMFLIQTSFDNSGRIERRTKEAYQGSDSMCERYRYPDSTRIEVSVANETKGVQLNEYEFQTNPDGTIARLDTKDFASGTARSLEYKYELDAPGNWITREVFESEQEGARKRLEIVRREIRYWD